MENNNRFTINNTFLKGLLISLTTVFLMIGLVGAGLFVCCAPFTTTALSTSVSKWEGSGLTHDEMVEAAEITRDYTVGSHDRSSVEAYEELDAAVLEHLDDVYEVVSTAQIMIIGIGAFGIIGCIFIGLGIGRRALGKTLFAAPGAIITIFAALALWVIFDFNGFFTFLHSLFFAEGTWTFSYDSLLIRMYPTEFWVGMGGVWFACTFLMSALCLILGMMIKGRKQ